MPASGVPGRQGLTYAEACEIPGVKAFLATQDRARLYQGPAGRRVPWALVGPFLHDWWRTQGLGLREAIRREERAEAEREITRRLEDARQALGDRKGRKTRKPRWDTL